MHFKNAIFGRAVASCQNFHGDGFSHFVYFDPGIQSRRMTSASASAPSLTPLLALPLPLPLLLLLCIFRFRLRIV